jgi:hypothetical protein
MNQEAPEGCSYFADQAYIWWPKQRDLEIEARLFLAASLYDLFAGQYVAEGTAGLAYGGQSREIWKLKQGCSWQHHCMICLQVNMLLKEQLGWIIHFWEFKWHLSLLM